MKAKVISLKLFRQNKNVQLSEIKDDSAEMFYRLNIHKPIDKKDAKVCLVYSDKDNKKEVA